MSDAFRDPLLAATVARLLRAPHALTWGAIQGLGFMQANLIDTEHEKLAIHVWHPELREPDLLDSGMLHTHRFAFRSLVLLGAIHDTEIVSLTPTDSDEDAYRIHQVTWHDQGQRKLISTELPERYRLLTSPHTYRAGATYSYPVDKFHTSEVDTLTVTLCHKTGEFGGGRLLARVGQQPVHLNDMHGTQRFTAERTKRIRREAANALLASLGVASPEPEFRVLQPAGPITIASRPATEVP